MAKIQSPLQSKTLTPAEKYAAYPGKDLAAMALASNYRRWIIDILEPFVGRHIVEVGAGAGAFSELLLAIAPESLTVLEPSFNLYSHLEDYLPRLDSKGILEVRHSNFQDAWSDSPQRHTPDTAVYINVLEHIDEDEAELEAVYAALPPGGRILVFVPALPFLMSRMDRELGHFRRYTMKELTTKCSTAGFQLKLARYFDLVGIALWWIKYRVMQSNTMEPHAVRMHDRFVVPVSRTLESVITPPWGKNIILVGQKPPKE
jgi:SAM-dependent methyltransferase